MGRPSCPSGRGRRKNRFAFVIEPGEDPPPLGSAAAPSRVDRRAATAVSAAWRSRLADAGADTSDVKFGALRAPPDPPFESRLTAPPRTKSEDRGPAFRFGISPSNGEEASSISPRLHHSGTSVLLPARHQQPPPGMVQIALRWNWKTRTAAAVWPIPAGLVQARTTANRNTVARRIRNWPARRYVRFTSTDYWSEREDLNLRPPEPHSGALPGCATLRRAVL
jgi:hypothetical protein